MGHISCIVQTMGFPVSHNRVIDFSDKKPWLIQLSITTSASFIHRCDAMLRPWLAISALNRFFRENPLRKNMFHRSDMKLYLSISGRGT